VFQMRPQSVSVSGEAKLGYTAPLTPLPNSVKLREWGRGRGFATKR
jgi:hypothetical protein